MYSAYLHDKVNALKDKEKTEQLHETKAKLALQQRKKKNQSQDSVGSMTSEDDPTENELAVMRIQSKLVREMLVVACLHAC